MQWPLTGFSSRHYGAFSGRETVSLNRPQTSDESGETLLCSDHGWHAEAEAVIKDVSQFVRAISVSEKLQVTRFLVALPLRLLGGPIL
jgi:hypothetical protein